MTGSARRTVPHWFGAGTVFLAVILLFVIFVRIRLLDFPLERDEGEYAYIGQLILQGIPPYSEAYTMKFPGTSLMYALIMAVFGQTAEGIHLGLLIINCASIIVVYVLCREISTEFAAVTAAGAYAVLSLSQSVYGFAAHATHFVILPALGGALLLLHALKQDGLPRYFWSGMLMGLSFLMKQPGVFFVLFGAVYLLYHHYSSGQAQTGRALLRKLGIFTLGASAPVLAAAWWIYAGGAFDKFWFWTVTYATAYGGQVPLSAVFTMFRVGFAYVVDGFILVWIIAAAGLIALVLHRRLKKDRVFVVLFAASSCFSLCPGFYFRQHYFVMLLPAVAVLVGLLMDIILSQVSAVVPRRWSPYAVAGCLGGALLAGIGAQHEYLFREQPAQLSRNIYGDNLFDQSREIARFLQARSAENDTIAVLGSEPQILFYAKRRSSTGYLYTYGLMEQHDYSLRMQKDMIREIEAARPKFVILVYVFTSWLVRPESEKYIFDWIDTYVRERYELAGVVDLLTSDDTVYQGAEDARSYRAQSPSQVQIYERK